MKVIAEWMELRVKQYEDGKFEGYEALGDQGKEGTWEEVRKWICGQLMDEIETVMFTNEGTSEEK